MKNKAVKKLQPQKKAATLVQKSGVQKSNIKKKPAQNKQKLLKNPDANLSAKVKLSGKIFSPTVEKAKEKNAQQKKIAKNSSSTGKIEPSPEKEKILPAANNIKINKSKTEIKKEKTVQKKNKNAKPAAKEKEEVISQIKKKPKVEKSVSVVISKTKKKPKVLSPKVEKSFDIVISQIKKKPTVDSPKVEKSVDIVISQKKPKVDSSEVEKSVEVVISQKKPKVDSPKVKKSVDIVISQKKPKVDSPKVEKSVEVVISQIKKKPKVDSSKTESSVDGNQQDKAEVTSKKRKIKSEKSESRMKKVKTEEVKVESGSSPVTSEIKNEDQKVVSKPRRSKIKRKSSVTNIKDLKPISNIKSLVKRPARKIAEAKKKNKGMMKLPERGVCYFSHIPHGFYEKELKKYCSQFGEVTGVYHPVSKNGNSRGYAFVEFKHKEVAEVVADTMNNYLMFNRLVKCKYIPPDSQRPWVFKQTRNNMKEAALRRQTNLEKQMRSLSKEEVKKWKKRRQRRVKSIHKKLEKLGVDYEFQVHDSNENVVKEETKVEE